MKLMQFILRGGALMLLLFSCGTSKQEKEDVTRSDTTVLAEQKKMLGEIDTTFKPDQKEIPYRGNFLTAAKWTDGRGENVIVISHRPQYFWTEENPSMGKFAPDKENDTEIAELFAYHYIYNSDLKKWKAYWALHDFEFGCCDVYMEYQPKSLHITDIDSNGLAESSFFYLVYGGTAGIDMYYGAKLIFHPDSVKYKVEGTTGLGKNLVEPGNGGIVKETYDKKLNADQTAYLKTKWAQYHAQQCSIDSVYYKAMLKAMEEN